MSEGNRLTKGMRLGRFTLVSQIGRGGMGVVWKAHDDESDQIVALKLLHVAYADQPEYVARFERELQLAQRIHSDHVVSVLGHGMFDGTPYLALEYVDGQSLRQHLAEHGPYGWVETRALLLQVASGLADAHAVGVVHRDVKPSNILIGTDKCARLADFGIAKGVDLTRVTGSSALLGTPAYLAPEGAKDERSDLYSLGIVAFELLTGSPPFEGDTFSDVMLAHMRTPPDLERLPVEARSVVGWMLEKDPNARPQTVAALVAVLEGRASVPDKARATTQPATDELPTRRLPSPQQRSRRRRRAGMGLFAGAGAVALIAVVALGASRGGPVATPTPTATPGNVALASATRTAAGPTGSHAQLWGPGGSADAGGVVQSDMPTPGIGSGSPRATPTPGTASTPGPLTPTQHAPTATPWAPTATPWNPTPPPVPTPTATPWWQSPTPYVPTPTPYAPPTPTPYVPPTPTPYVPTPTPYVPTPTPYIPTPTPLQPPAPPYGVTATVTGMYSIWVGWTINSDNETGFQIQDQSYATNTVGAGVNSYTWSVNPGTSDCFEVRAYNDAGYSGWAGWSCAGPTPTPTPSPTQCYRPSGNGVTIYSGTNYQGSSITLNPPPGVGNNEVTNLSWKPGSFTSNGSWMVVFFAAYNGGGNMTYYDARTGVPDLSSIWSQSATDQWSVKVYVNGC